MTEQPTKSCNWGGDRSQAARANGKRVGRKPSKLYRRHVQLAAPTKDELEQAIRSTTPRQRFDAIAAIAAQKVG